MIGSTPVCFHTGVKFMKIHLRNKLAVLQAKTLAWFKYERKIYEPVAYGYGLHMICKIAAKHDGH
eukprot:6828125-Karenia_brevis.AAC.1